MESQAVAEGHTVDQTAFAFVQDLAKDLNRNAIEIPSFPDIAFRVKSVLDDENATSEKIARVVSSEPTLAARLLTLANSVLLNRSGQQVLDVKTAVNRLGYDQIHTAATALAIKSLTEKQSMDKLKPYFADLWNHSVYVAAIAYSLARRTRGINPDEAMFVGLVHDIGKLYIYTKIEDHPALLSDPDRLASIVEDWHTAIGKAILESWDFPEHVLEAVEQHHDHERPPIDSPDLTDVIVVANLFSHSKTSDVDMTGVASYQRFGLDEEEFQRVMAESESEIEEQMRALSG